ncbi:hypothetical protein ECC02_008374 [Trypanosoma cruzi]|uniref:Uncharacterized protein n=1 Tax=Trypanosoma cruzi TaxID=5693 RepID=A0A7J6XW87_TRYCR|nr:hypothetical protein ECC02_008374 [Trypanosoma cruzi]
MPKGSHFFPPDTSTDECNCRALRPLDPFETTLRPHGEGSMWLAIRSSRRGKTIQKVGWWARTFAPLMPASTARVKHVFPTAALRVAETPALTPAMTSASACNSSTPPVKKKTGAQTLQPHIPRNHLQTRFPAETPEQHNKKTVHCWQGIRARCFHPATEDYASCVTRPQVRSAPTPKRWACCPMTLPLHRGPRSATDHPPTKEKTQWSEHCSVRTTQQKHPQRTNALECPSEGASGLAVKQTNTGEPPALHASNDAIGSAMLQGTSTTLFSSPSVRARRSCHHPSSSQSIPQGPLNQRPPHGDIPPDEWSPYRTK